MYKLVYTSKFKKDIKLCYKREYNFSELKIVIETLESYGKLPQKYNHHVLSGNFSKHWECHIKPDWLLIWLQDEKEKEITFVRTGTHSDLF